jgi:hypothetical protein
VEEWLDPQDEVAFEGTIQAIPDASRALLAQALAAPLALGRGTALGRGQVAIEFCAPPALEPLEARGARFESALRDRLGSLGFDAGLAGELVPITLLAPLVPSRADSDGREELAAALGRAASGTGLEWILGARRFTAEGGFDQRAGQPTAALAVAAGGVFVARIRGGWQPCSQALAALEREGAGTRRHQGYGRLLCFDPLISQKPIGELPQ